VRSRIQMGVIDLDEDFLPRGAPTMIDPEVVGHRLTRIEDVRLFKFRGELLLMFEGMQPILRPDGTPVRSTLHTPYFAESCR
jgi:hypothetical protein